MCIVAIGHQASGRYPLIVAANRDERHARPSLAADWWEPPVAPETKSASLLGGRDLEAGGTWLGVTRSGRFAAVTNIFEGGGATAERSRGELVTDFLTSSEAPAVCALSVDTLGASYGPFNLVLRDGNELEFVSNRNSSASLGAGIHVFSNNSPGLQWTKVGVLREMIEQAADRDDLTEALLGALSGAEARGPLERAADSLFVVGKEFGTRCTTVLTIDRAGRANFIEQRYSAGGETAGRSEFAFDIAYNRSTE